MAPKKSNATVARKNSAAVKKAWAIARKEDVFCFNNTPEEYSRKYCINVKPRKEDRSFRSSINTLGKFAVWDVESQSFGVMTFPTAYVIHIWWIQLQAKFWTDTFTGPQGKTMGIYLTWLIDGFVEEVVKDMEASGMVAGWQSKTLHGILCRTFYHMREEDVMSDFTVILRSTRNTTGNSNLRFEDIDRDAFRDIYHKSDVMSDECRAGTYFLTGKNPQHLYPCQN